VHCVPSGHELLLKNSREIIDESDVFVDVHKAIRRMAPAPRFRVPKGAVVADVTQPTEQKLDAETATDPEQAVTNGHHKPSITELASSPKAPTYLMRRRSSGHGESRDRGALALPLRSDDPEVLRHLKHLGPSNSATRPKQTRINTVKIKPGIPNTILENGARPADGAVVTPSLAPQGGIGEGILESAGREASDGVHSLVVGYGTISQNADRMSWKSGKSGVGQEQTQEGSHSPKSTAADETNETSALIVDNNYNATEPRGRTKSVSTIGSLHSHKTRSQSPPKRSHTARSGSISENIVDVNGVRKIILETTSSSDSDQKQQSSQMESAQAPSPPEGSVVGEDNSGKKKRKKRGKKKKTAGEGSESQPLLGSN
jgi:metal transporter CNNM